MKVLILSSSEKIKKAEKIKTLCRQLGADSSIYGENSNLEVGLSSYLVQNDLIIIVWDENSIYNHEIVFSTGFCVGKGKSFVLYRVAEQGPPLCNGKAVVFSKKEDLKTFITGEVKKNKEQLSIESAKSKILEMGLEISVRDFIEAVFKGEILAVLQFIKAGYSPNICDKNGVFLLNLAVRSGHMKTADILIDNGAEINSISGDRGNTPLMDAAAEANTEILIKMIKAGADLNLKSKSGQTALVLSVGRKVEDAAIILIESGADINIKDDLGMSALKYAELFKLEQVLLLMRKDKNDT